MGPARLGVVAVGSVAAIATSLIAGAGLWERARGDRAREQVVLFNLATTATVVLGVLTLYGALFVLSLLAGLLLLVPGVLAAGLGHPVTLGDYAELAWLTTSLATVGGALGAGLESEDAVHEAAYTYRSSEAGPGEGAAGEPEGGPDEAGEPGTDGAGESGATRSA